MANDIVDFVFRNDFRVSGDGTVNQISRAENVKSALLNRLSVFTGSIPFRPSYGSDLKRFVSEPSTKELNHRVSKLVTDQLNRETRIKRVDSVNIERKTDGTFIISADIILVDESSIRLNREEI